MNIRIMFLDFLGLFLHITGFIIGLGATTVIDLHGFLGRHSPYWTEATIRTHKITKPLIWLGVMLAVIGGALFYRADSFSPLHLIQILILFFLVSNGCFLSFWVSPRLLKREQEGRAREFLPTSWQQMITVSFLISFVGWWSQVALLVWSILHVKV